MTELTTEEKEIIATALWHYLKDEYRELCDFKYVIEHREAVTINGETCYKYECPIQTIYLNNDAYAVTYEKQYVVDYDGDGVIDYYYDFNDDGITDEAGTYDYIGPWEWKRDSIGGGGAMDWQL